MSKGFKFISIVLVLCALYAAFIVFVDKKKDPGSLPEISAPEGVLQVSVDADKKTLLKDVMASDAEDGDLTSQVYIESISAFDDENQRTVTYAVFDTDDHIARTTRKIKYKDYKAPVITVEKPLCYYFLHSVDEYKNFVSASSSVDGDISSQITIESEMIEDNKNYVIYSVTDSCGTKTTLKLKADILNTEPNIEISLSDYMLRVPAGTEIYPEEYITQIKIMGVVDNSLVSSVEISTDYNAAAAGIYEFIYRISQSGGDYGITKLVVVVE